MAEGTPPGEGAGGGGIRGTLTKKWGPLPVWVYGVVGAGVLFLFMRGRSSGGSSSGGFAVGSPLTAASAAPGTTTDTGAPATAPTDQGTLLAALAQFADAIRNQAPPVVNVYGTGNATTSPQSSASAGHDAAPARAYTYASPGPAGGQNVPKGAPMQNVRIGGKIVPISLSDSAVKSGAVLPDAVPLN